jgi:hypothetical protein
MPVNVVAIGVAAVAVFLFAAAYYVVLARPRAGLSATGAAGPRPRPWVMALELLKSVCLASVIAGLVNLAGIAGISDALKLSLALWVAFPVVLLAGSVTYENVPWKLAAIHAGDWLAKLIIITVVVSLWR